MADNTTNAPTYDGATARSGTRTPLPQRGRRARRRPGGPRHGRRRGGVPCRRPGHPGAGAPRPELLDRLPAARSPPSCSARVVETNTAVCRTLDDLRADLVRAAQRPRGRRRRSGSAWSRPAPSRWSTRLAAGHPHRPLRADARRLPDARPRAADLRRTGARRGPRPRRRGRGRTAGGRRSCRCCSRCRPARRTGWARTAATPASGRWSGSAGPRPATAGELTSAAEHDALVADLIASGRSPTRR